MEEQQATTPTDVAQPSIDDRIAAKFGLDQPAPTEEAPETPVPATDQEAEPEEVDVEAEEETPPPAPDGFEEIVHKGEVKRVSKEEMRNLAQKGFDYESNMVQNKAERQRLQGIATALEAQQALHAQVIEHVAEAKAYEKQLAPYANVDWIRYANEDPISAFQAKQVYDDLVAKRNQAYGTAQQVATQHQQATTHVTQEQLAFEGQELLKRIPEWKDDAKANTEKQAIAQDLRKMFTAEELGRWGGLFADHRVIALMRDSWKYRLAVEAGKAKKGQLQGLPQPAKPGARQQPPSKTQTVTDARSDLRKARSPETRKAAEDRMIAAKFGIKL